MLIALTGLRRGEALALTWDRVDLDTGMLKVAATIGRVDGQLVITEPKTGRSRRPVPLHPAVVDVLRQHRALQDAERQLVGSDWRESGLVFTTELGGPVDPRNLLRVVEVAAKRAGIECAGVHTLRHSAAVAWLEAGVHIKASGRSIGALVDRDHGRRVRPHVLRCRALGGGEVGPGCEAVTTDLIHEIEFDR